MSGQMSPGINSTSSQLIAPGPDPCRGGLRPRGCPHPHWKKSLAGGPLRDHVCLQLQGVSLINPFFEAGILSEVSRWY